MYLIQILLPLYDNNGRSLRRTHFDEVSETLTDRFGGLTAHTRAPAEGLWQKGKSRPQHDDIIIYEVMAEKLQKAWWRHYRKELESRFRQEKIVIRAQKIDVL